MAITRRKFLLGLGALGAAGIAYTRLIESAWLEVREVAVELRQARLSAPIKILHLSDLHWSSAVPLTFIEKAIGEGLKHQPDLVCLTGDLTTAGEKRDLGRLGRALQALADNRPAAAVLGNHDGGAWSRMHGGFQDGREITGLLREAGFLVLFNDSRLLEISGQRLALAGTGDLWSGACDPLAAFRGIESENPRATLLLAHNPDTKDLAGRHAWDLMLSGHTHGGQVSLPLLGAPIVPVKDRRYVAGLGPWGERWIYTTRGVGSLYGIRFGCRPEVTILSVS